MSTAKRKIKDAGNTGKDQQQPVIASRGIPGSPATTATTKEEEKKEVASKYSMKVVPVTVLVSRSKLLLFFVSMRLGEVANLLLEAYNLYFTYYGNPCLYNVLKTTTIFFNYMIISVCCSILWIIYTNGIWVFLSKRVKKSGSVNPSLEPLTIAADEKKEKRAELSFWDVVEGVSRLYEKLYYSERIDLMIIMVCIYTLGGTLKVLALVSVYGLLQIELSDAMAASLFYTFFTISGLFSYILLILATSVNRSLFNFCCANRLFKKPRKHNRKIIDHPAYFNSYMFLTVCNVVLLCSWAFGVVGKGAASSFTSYTVTYTITNIENYLTVLGAYQGTGALFPPNITSYPQGSCTVFQNGLPIYETPLQVGSTLFTATISATEKDHLIFYGGVTSGYTGGSILSNINVSPSILCSNPSGISISSSDIASALSSPVPSVPTFLSNTTHRSDLIAPSQYGVVLFGLDWTLFMNLTASLDNGTCTFGGAASL